MAHRDSPQVAAWPLARVKGGHRPAKRTLEARKRLDTLAHGWMQRFIASSHGRRRSRQAA
jgi:hypothetical protein